MSSHLLVTGVRKGLVLGAVDVLAEAMGTAILWDLSRPSTGRGIVAALALCAADGGVMAGVPPTAAWRAVASGAHAAASPLCGHDAGVVPPMRGVTIATGVPPRHSWAWPPRETAGEGRTTGVDSGFEPRAVATGVTGW